VLLELGGPPRRQAEKVGDAVEDRSGIGEQVARVDDVDPVPAEGLLQPFELVDVPAAGDVGVVLWKLRYSGSATSFSSSPAVRCSSSSRARSNASVSKPLASSCACAEYARSTGSRSSTSSRTPGRSASIRAPASGWNM
jgi:hypothetical protein